MTLRRVRIPLGNRVAGIPGVGFVATTRVRHPSHLIFEGDLPEWSAFQEAQCSANFRSQCRFELRMRTLFSGTFRKYGHCVAHPWFGIEAQVAAK